MTTSVSYFAHGRVLASLYLQPMGAMLGLLAAGGFWLGLYEATSARPVHRVLLWWGGRWFLIGVASWAILAWGWKILIHLMGIDGWHG